MTQIKDIAITKTVANANDFLVLQNPTTGETYKIKKSDFLAGLSSGSGDSGTSSDPYLSNVLVYLKGNGTNGSTSIVDSSPTPKIISLLGNVKISTTQFKTGNSSIYFDGTGDYLSLDGNLDSQQFTIESWIYPTNQQPEFFTNADANNSIQDGQKSLGGYSVDWVLSKWGFGTMKNYGASLFNLNAWNHLAFARDSNNICKLFLNGIQKGSDFTFSESFNFPKTIIGYNGSSQYATFLSGYIDSYRITANIARYTANFNPLTDTYLE